MSPEWCGLPAGVRTLEQAEAYWASGDPQVLDRIRQALGKIEVPRMTNVRRCGRWGAEGDEVSQERVWSGQLETAWRTTARVNVAAPTRVRIVADVGAHGIVRAEDLAWRGAAALALADALCAAGYTVSIEAVYCNKSEATDNLRRLSLTVKDWTAPLSLTTLAATIGTASWFRMGFLTLCYTVSEWRESVGGSYHNNVTEDIMRELYGDEPNVTRLLVPASVLSAPSAQVWLTQIAKALEAQAHPAA